MAGYQSNRQYTNNRTNTQGSSAAATDKGAAGATAREANLFQTGLWKPEKGAALATVQVREDLTIPAGSYINVFVVDDVSRYKGNPPSHKMTIRKGTLRTTK